MPQEGEQDMESQAVHPCDDEQRKGTEDMIVHAAQEVRKWMGSRGVAEVRIELDGYADQGRITNVTGKRADGAEESLVSALADRMSDCIDTLGYGMAEAVLPGWDTEEGSSVAVVVGLKSPVRAHVAVRGDVCGGQTEELTPAALPRHAEGVAWPAACAWLAANSPEGAVIRFGGYGGSGSWEPPVYGNGKQVDDPIVVAVLEVMASRLLENVAPGWEAGDGSTGELVFSVAGGATVNIAWRRAVVDEFERVLAIDDFELPAPSP